MHRVHSQVTLEFALRSCLDVHDIKQLKYKGQEVCSACPRCFVGFSCVVSQSVTSRLGPNRRRQLHRCFFSIDFGCSTDGFSL